MIRLLVRDISPLFDGGWEKHLHLLPAERRERTLRLRGEETPARSVGAYLTLREAFAAEGIDIAMLSLQTDAQGKPFFADAPHFSLSHAGPYAAAAVSDKPVGVDIEAARCTMKIAKRFFAPAEIKAAGQLEGDARALYLQRLWVAKEAFIKMLGTGLSTPLDSFVVVPGEDHIALSQTLTTAEVIIRDYPVGEYRVAVAGEACGAVETDMSCPVTDDL